MTETTSFVATIAQFPVCGHIYSTPQRGRTDLFSRVKYIGRARRGPRADSFSVSVSEYDRTTCNYIGLRSFEVEEERTTVESDHNTRSWSLGL